MSGWANSEILTWLPVNDTLKRELGISNLTGRQGHSDGYAVIDSRGWNGIGLAKIYSHNITGPVCMKFFFYLSGPMAGRVQIKTEKVGSDNSETAKTVFIRYGHHGNEWNFGQIYLDFNDSDVYKIIISGKVGNYSVKSSPAIDDISFTNDSCEQHPSDTGLNCTFGNDRCGWTVEKVLNPKFAPELNQYLLTTYISYEHENFFLKSPLIWEHKGCFRFNFHAVGNVIGHLFVFVVDGNKRKMPVWNANLDSANKWLRIDVGLNFTSGFSQIIFEGLSVLGRINFANFVFHPQIGTCKSIEEKTFFVHVNSSDPPSYLISNHGVLCGEEQATSYFTARVLPNAMFSIPMFMYSLNGDPSFPYQSLRDYRDDSAYGNLMGYFYVSSNCNPDTLNCVHYSRQDGGKYSYISEFGPISGSNTTDKVFSVKSFKEIKDKICPRDWINLAGKCFKFICDNYEQGKHSWTSARMICLKNQADLASLNATTLPLIIRYLEHIRVRQAGFTAVSVGLFRKGRQWSWLNGQSYEGNLGLKNFNGRLMWNETIRNWHLQNIEGARSSLHLCEKIRVNAAFLSMTNQSSTKLDFSSDLAVDGIYSSCTLTKQTFYPSWWHVNLNKDIKIYQIMVSSLPRMEDILSLYVTHRFLNSESMVTFKQVITVNRGAATVVCEPPVDGTSVKLETLTHKSLSICEVEIYGTESLRELSGVSREFWKGIMGKGLSALKTSKNYPDHPDFFHVIPTFDPPKVVEDEYGQVLQAYFMPDISGNYTFYLTGDGDVEFYILHSRGTETSPFVLILQEQLSLKAYQRDKYPSNQKSPAQYFHACQFYFLKVVMSELHGEDHVSLGIEYPNGTYEGPMSGKNLFWILPGKQEISFSLNKTTVKDITIGDAFTMTGIYSWKCVGLYCGDCPLAVFLTFTGHFKCILIPSQPVVQNGTLSLTITSWYLPVGPGKVLMGFQTGGNCSLFTNSVDLNVMSNVNISEIGTFNVKPVLLVSCQFQTSKFCDNVDNVIHDGWIQMKTWIDDSSQYLYGIKCTVNTTASFSFKWITVSKLEQQTGICVRFNYLMSGGNNSLSLLVQMFSGDRKQVWSLHGDHGNEWNSASIRLSPNEDLMLVFEAKVIHPNTTVAISSVSVTGEACQYLLYPPFALPGYNCSEKGQFQCENGVCIRSSLACDGDLDCTDGSDEKYCQCLIEQFKCRTSSRCISISRLCDDVKDCADGSDENHCRLGCKSDEYYCPGGKCVPWNATCNGEWDCLSGGDEPEICGIPRGDETAIKKTCSLNDLACTSEFQNDTYDYYSEGNCDFENGLCEWHQEEKGYDDFDWTLKNGQTLSQGTGPSTDHTTNSALGGYIYIEASSPRKSGDTARLHAGPFQGGQNVSFIFYYHMFGEHIGRLSVYKTSLNRTDEQLLWTRNGSITAAWNKAEISVQSKNDYRIIIEGVRGDGALGDIAIDDISVINGNYSDIENDIPPFCSFEESCGWKLDNDKWIRHEYDLNEHFILQGNYISAKRSAHLKFIVSKKLASEYRCMSFWYKGHPCSGMEISVAQTFNGIFHKYPVRLSMEEEWKFAEIHLRRSLKEYTVVLNLTIPDDASEKCYSGIDEINFSLEPCLFSQHDGPVWVRASSKFYRGFKVDYKDKIYVFPHSPQAPKYFYSIYSSSVNAIVMDAASVDYSKIVLGARVIVENVPDYAILGTVIKKDNMKTQNKSKSLYKLIVRLDLDGTDLPVVTEKVLLLPFQMKIHGKSWRNTMQECTGSFVYDYNTSCYSLIREKMNWFDGVDLCKSYGGETVSFETQSEERSVNGRFGKLPFWIGYHGHEYAGYNFGWSDGSDSLYSKLNPESLRKGLSSGLCTVVKRGVTDTQWKRWNCSEKEYTICKSPGREKGFICSNMRDKTLKCKIPGAVLVIHQTKILKTVFNDNPCRYSDSASKKSCKNLFASETDAYRDVRSICQGKTQCSISITKFWSVTGDPCSSNRKYLTVIYSCQISPDISKMTSVLCPTDSMTFKSSCYKFNGGKPFSWFNASKYCELGQGTLVTFNSEDEERFVLTNMQSQFASPFWIGLSDDNNGRDYKWLDKSNSTYRNWISGGVVVKNGTRQCVTATGKGWHFENCSQILNYVCEYELAPGSCDFEENWCGWRAKNTNKSRSHWKREFIQGNTSSIVTTTQPLPSNWQNKTVKIYLFEHWHDHVVKFLVNRDDYPSEFTLCLWLFPYANVTEASIINLYEGRRNLKIYFNDSNFIIIMQRWRITTRALVSFGEWQHVCFSIDTNTSMWNFYKDGSLTDLGILSVPRIIDSWDIVVGSEMNCKTTFRCQISKRFSGKTTKPTMWSRLLKAHEVAMVSTGCGPLGSGDVHFLEPNSNDIETITVSDGECVQGKGFRLIYRQVNFTSHSTSTFISPWMKNGYDVSRGVCVTFAYRLVGKFCQIELEVQRKNMNGEVLWKVKNLMGARLWEYGQVFLGILQEFRVLFFTSLREKNSEANIDNVFFKKGFCEPVPREAQEWKTQISNISSGFLLSPYYPSFYLNKMKRQWEIIFPVGQRIKLEFLFFNVEKGPKCNMDFLAIRDGTMSKKRSYHCGNILPSTFISKTNTLLITFKSNENIVRQGFKIRYERVDAESVEDEYGGIALSCPAGVYCHRLRSNKTKIYVTARGLSKLPSLFPKNTSAINFDKNYLTQLTNGSFSDLTKLEYLSLTENRIVRIEGWAFRNVNGIKTIRLSANFIKEIPETFFRQTKSLDVLDLGINKIEQLEGGLFLSLCKLRVLSLRFNHLKILNDGIFSELLNLQYLYLDNNRLSQIGENVFKELETLNVLTLAGNHLSVLRASWLKGKRHLRRLDLRHNRLKEIEPRAFQDLGKLVHLDLSENLIRSIPESLFNPLGSLKSLKVDHFTLCCYAKQINPGVSCTSQNDDGFSSCDELLKNTILKYSIWILGVMALVGNLVVILWRMIGTDRSQLNSFLLTNLAVSDFLMGVYMLIIAYKNTVWQGVYFKHDVSWRDSALCIFAGIISTISSEVSVFTLTVMTCDRMICLVFPFRFQRMSMKKAVIIMTFVWLLGLAIAVLPLFHDDYFYDNVHNVHFYGRSAVCLPFQLSTEKSAGWEYSSFIFIFLNGFSFLYMFVAYLIMYRAVTKASNAARSTRMNLDSTLAKRMMFIILTDFFCWFPVIIMSILSLTGHLYDPRKQVYAWIAVFVLPINSSINPVLYTFSTPLVREKKPQALGKKP